MRLAKTGRSVPTWLLPAGLVAVLSCFHALGQQPAAVPNAQPQPMKWTAAEDHRNMMEQLGIKALRPGPNGNEKAPDHANFDEDKANPYPNWPDVLTLKSGKKVASAKSLVEQRRPEIVEDFDREVLGRVPANVPRSIGAWRVRLIRRLAQFR